MIRIVPRTSVVPRAMPMRISVTIMLWDWFH